jgi:hypothetical protein
MTDGPRHRSRPTPALLASLRKGKSALHGQRASMTLREKVTLVLELQRVCLPLIKQRRQLAPWEHPWSITP